ncbi:hypothetical protein M5X00_28320 [Paenibacillus alvei]|uniref:Uncharacterized protein n=1 Tax=Paenibacillus alvei TaxID=44250 RepID=A0ABT4H5I3_PAEAL|nr:hypothetical protein [Paenibacillus alvei]EJW14418.1 hypothetical protein PAV_13c00370 [Paenibacillus alvei DSM 29]MCY9539191.1 hypothetical protein [Paenibacillus alvei]MCY9708708.1 hypothetical protein [Paenibacillus alvei]MCY9737288.1 hypothetical protein [Paenibacillus alvei]MCY9758134.1 hypothetical protein [Paenibacillus alvei]
MELTRITGEIHGASQRLSRSADALFDLGREKAESERDYRSALAQEILRLKADGMPVSIITDIAKGNVSKQLFQRDLAEARFKAGIEAADAIKVQVSALQTILKYQTDV